MRLALGIDLGATKSMAVLWRADGRVIESLQMLTRRDLGFEAAVERLKQMVSKLEAMAEGEIVAAGIGLAGQIDPQSAELIETPNLNWVSKDLYQAFSGLCNCPMVFLNDVHAAVWGEWQQGAAKGLNDVLGVFVGTGIGGGVITDKQLMRGATGCAGEIGHIGVESEGVPCTCGSIGCVEAYAGGWGIAQRTLDLVQAKAKGWEHFAACDPLTCREVVAAYFRANPLAKRVIDQAVKALVMAVTTAVHCFNPECIVMGGGVLEGLPDLIKLVEEGVHNRAFKAAQRKLRFVPAQLGVGAVAVGAASYALSEIQSEPF
ncbi:MAG: ROK family protein [Chlamydiia bacterium]|nr:ROK family protein [Chlamydiia bacterium]